MTEFIYHKAGATEAQQKKALAFLLAQDSAGLATDGTLSGLLVTQTGTASADVLVAAGAAVAQDTAGNGASMLINDTQKTLDVLTANPMGATARNDLVVFDSATTSIRVVVGTPNVSPTDPALPSTATALARLRHAASATTVPTAKIDDLRTKTHLFGAFNDDGSYTGSVAFSGNVTAANGLGQTSGSHKKVHVQSFIGGTTDASGFLTFSHSAGFTPRVAMISSTNPASTFALYWGCDTLTGSSVRTRWMHANTAGAYASASTGSFVAVFWE